MELAVTEAGWATGGPQPPEGFRRVQLLYLVPTGQRQSMRLAYRGFERTDTVEVR